MPDDHFERTSLIKAPVEELRDWHFREGAFLRLNPPWEKAEVVESFTELKDGARAVIEVGMGPLKQRWIADHEVTPDGFIDRQTKGPFAHWEHHHRFEAIDPETSRLTDSITYRLPFGLPGKVFGGPLVRAMLNRMFRYRHEITRLDLERSRVNPPPRPLSILLTGGTGLIGTALTGYLQTQGHAVHRVTRTPRHPGDIGWDPEAQRLDLPTDLALDAVIHLAGENVAGGRWTEEKKRRLLESRRLGTRLIAETIAKMEKPPAVLISASGSGYYPHDGSTYGESGPQGDHFLARVCEVWESETAAAQEAGVRVVLARLGVVLSPAGGALEKLVPVFLSGLGGPVGHGRQHLSWIVIDDVLDILHRALFEETWEGAMNLTAPEPVTSRDFSKALGRVLRRPSFFPSPAAVLKLFFGEMAEETLLADIAVVPEKLEALGYSFRYPDLRSALSHVLGRDPHP